MRVPTLATAFAVLLLVVASPTSTSGEDFSDVGKVTRLIRVFGTPQLAPGEQGVFSFEFNSTYTEPMDNVTLRADVYMYATIDGAIPVDGAWTYPYPRIAESAGGSPREIVWDLGTVPAGNRTLLNFTILTSPDEREMPRGSVFSQAAYFVRFRLDFDANVSGAPRAFVMKSLGHFTPEEWGAANNETNTTPCTIPWCRGRVNLTMLQVDGILPDSSFGVKEPIPVWPFYVLAAGASVSLVLAFLFWVEENPGTFPRIETWWARTRGRFARLRPARRRPRRS